MTHCLTSDSDVLKFTLMTHCLTTTSDALKFVLTTHYLTTTSNVLKFALTQQCFLVHKLITPTSQTMSKQQNSMFIDNLLLLTLSTTTIPKAVKRCFAATVFKNANSIELCQRLNALATMSNLLQVIKLYDSEFDFDSMINNFRSLSDEEFKAHLWVHSRFSPFFFLSHN